MFSWSSYASEPVIAEPLEREADKPLDIESAMLRRIDEGLPGARRWLGMYRQMLLDPRYQVAVDASPTHKKISGVHLSIFAHKRRGSTKKARRGCGLRKGPGGRSPEPSADLRRAGQAPRARDGEEGAGGEGEGGEEVLLPENHYEFPVPFLPKIILLPKKEVLF